MRKLLNVVLLMLSISGSAMAQKYVTKTGAVSFFSKTPAEDISAVNKNVTAILSSGDKKIASLIIMRNFKFERPLMEEHFNENYLETSKYPKSTFLGSYAGDVDFSKNGTYPIQVSGTLILHGVTKQVSFPATITVNGDNVTADGKTQIALADYKVEIPKLVFYKIAEKIDIMLHLSFKK